MKGLFDVTIQEITEQPLHKTLKQYRIVALVCIGFIGWLIFDLLNWYKENALELSTEATAALYVFLPILLGAFVKSFNNIREKHEE